MGPLILSTDLGWFNRQGSTFPADSTGVSTSLDGRVMQGWALLADRPHIGYGAVAHRELVVLKSRSNLLCVLTEHEQGWLLAQHCSVCSRAQGTPEPCIFKAHCTGVAP